MQNDVTITLGNPTCLLGGATYLRACQALLYLQGNNTGNTIQIIAARFALLSRKVTATHRYERNTQEVEIGDSVELFEHILRQEIVQRVLKCKDHIVTVSSNLV